MVYVGQSSNLYSRRCTHLTRLRRGVHDNSHFQRAFDKCGEAALAWKVLEICEVDNIDAREQFWMDSFGAEKLYNIAPQAGSLRGLPRSEETKRRLRAAHLGKIISPETRKRMSESRRGKKRQPHSEATKAKLSAALLAISPDVRERIAAGYRAARSKWTMSAAGRERLRAANIGRKQSAEHSAKKRDSMKRFWALKKERENHAFPVALQYGP